MKARDFYIEDTLRNETKVVIRSVRGDDKERLVKAFSELDQETVYMRFFSHRSEIKASELARIDTIDFDRDVMLVVTTGKGDDEIVIAGASYATEAGSGARSAEIAFTVEEDYHGQGIAGRLLRHLVAIARASGIATFVADVLPGNKAMLAVFTRSGLPMSRQRADGVVHLTLDLATAKRQG